LFLLRRGQGKILAGCTAKTIIFSQGFAIWGARPQIAPKAGGGTEPAAGKLLQARHTYLLRFLPFFATITSDGDDTMKIGHELAFCRN
jgi:hypothetical protein